MAHPSGDGSIRSAQTRSLPVLGPSALRASALQRLGVVAVPTAVLWIAVALALDLFA